MSSAEIYVTFLRIRKKWLWLASLLPLLFISDILYGAMKFYDIEPSAISPGVILRGLVLITAVYMVINHQLLISKRLLIWIALLVLAVLPSFFVSIFYSKSIFFDLSAMSKVLYLPFVTGLFVVLIRKHLLSENDILRFIEYSAYMLGVVLLGSQVLGISMKSYGGYAFGTTGIFYAGNELTLAFGLGLLAAGYRLVMKRFSMVRMILLTMSAFACVQIGTRASLGVIIGAALTPVVCAAWERSSGRAIYSPKRVKKWLIGLFVLIAMSGTLFYGLAKQEEFRFQQQKLAEVAQGSFPRTRLLRVEAGAQHISERSPWFDLFGEGTDAFERGVAKHFYIRKTDRRIVEVDWMDIFGGYGIGFTFLIYAFVLSVLIRTIRQFVFRHDDLHGLIAAATILYVVQSAFAGHALMSPAPSTLMAAYFGIFFAGESRISSLLASRGYLLWLVLIDQ